MTSKIIYVLVFQPQLPENFMWMDYIF